MHSFIFQYNEWMNEWRHLQTCDPHNMNLLLFKKKLLMETNNFVGEFFVKKLDLKWIKIKMALECSLQAFNGSYPSESSFFEKS